MRCYTFLVMSPYSRDIICCLVYNYNGYYSGLTYERLVLDSKLSTYYYSHYCQYLVPCHHHLSCGKGQCGDAFIHIFFVALSIIVTLCNVWLVILQVSVEVVDRSFYLLCYFVSQNAVSADRLVSFNDVLYCLLELLVFQFVIVFISTLE